MNTAKGTAQLHLATPTPALEPFPVRSLSPTAPPAISLVDRLKAVGLITLTGAIGMGALLVGHKVWQSHQEDTLSPVSSESVNQQRSLRERVKVITPDMPILSPSPAAPASPPPTNRRTRRTSLQAALPHTSHGFGSNMPPIATAEDAAPDAEADTPATEPAPTQSNTVAVAPAQRLSVPQSPQGTATASAPPGSPPPSADQVVTALLQAPQSAAVPVAPIASAPSTVLAPPTPHPTPAEPPAPTVPPTAPTPIASEPAVSTPSPAPVPTQPTPIATQPAPIAPPVPAAPSPNPSGTESAPAPVAPALPSPSPSPIAAGSVPVPVPPPAAPAVLPPTAPPTAAAVTAAIGSPSLLEGIFVDRLRITGSTRFSLKQLAQVAQAAIASSLGNTPPNTQNQTASSGNPAIDPTVVNRKVPTAALVQASEAITKLYVDQGYINSGAYVPAEVLNGAPPEIRVVEGRVEAIQVSVQPPGFLWFGQPLSERYVRRRLTRWIWAPLQINQLADAVKLLEQDPLIAGITTKLLPGTTTGGSILKVDVRQAIPLHTSLSVDNGRSPSVGQLRQQFSLNQANLLGLGDVLQIGFNRSEGSHGLDVSYAIPLNPNNGTLSFSYSNNRGRVIEQPFRDLDIKSRSQDYEIALHQPIRQTATEVLALSLRATHYRNEGVFLESFNNGVALPLPARGTDPDGKTRVTALRFGQEWLKRGERDVISLQSEFSLGINALNATQLAIPPDGRFFSWQGRGFWVHSFAPDTLFALKGELQFANRPLVPVEQVSLGGIDTVRGYRTSTLLADNAAFASAELYLPVLRIPKWQSVVQIIPFFDIGRGWNRGDEQPIPNLLVATGLGLQWKISDKFRARLDWGIPLVNTTINGQSIREGLFFSVTLTP